MSTQYYLRRRGLSYTRKVLGIESANLIAYWPLGEASGTNADNAEGTAARDGTYDGVTLGQTGIGDGNTAPLFDGTNDFVNIFSASLETALNGDEGTISLWCKFLNAGVLTDGAARRIFNINAGADDNLSIYKNTTDNQLIYVFEGGGTLQGQTIAVTSIDWFHVAMSWSIANGEVKQYLNGNLENTDGSASAWTGTFNANYVVIGADDVTPAQDWSGWLAHCAIWTKPLSDANVLTLATV